jgi:hypothetical protein
MPPRRQAFTNLVIPVLRGGEPVVVLVAVDMVREAALVKVDLLMGQNHPPDHAVDRLEEDDANTNRQPHPQTMS